MCNGSYHAKACEHREIPLGKFLSQASNVVALISFQSSTAETICSRSRSGELTDFNLQIFHLAYIEGDQPTSRGLDSSQDRQDEDIRLNV